jgi:hypothetical protein
LHFFVEETGECGEQQLTETVSGARVRELHAVRLGAVKRKTNT